MMKSSFFETIKIQNAEILHLPYHQKRYEKTLDSFGMKNSHRLEDYIDPPDNELYRCKIIYSLEEIESVEYFPYNKRDVYSLQLVYDDKIDYSYKYTNRHEVDNLFALRKESDDILIVKNSLITDTSIANVAFYDGSDWFTPAKPLLHGTTRQRLLDEKKLLEADIRVQDLEKFRKTALLNAMIDFDIITDMSFEY